MRAQSVTMLGTGLIGDFYTMTLHGQRGRDRVRVVYSRTEDRGKAFSERWGIPEHTTDLVEATVHGVLHLCGYDHETDDGEMLELQQRVLRDLR